MPVLRVEVRVNEYYNTHRQTLNAYIIDLALFYFDLQVEKQATHGASGFPESDVALARHTTDIINGVCSNSLAPP